MQAQPGGTRSKYMLFFSDIISMIGDYWRIGGRRAVESVTLERLHVQHTSEIFC